MKTRAHPEAEQAAPVPQPHIPSGRDNAWRLTGFKKPPTATTFLPEGPTRALAAVFWAVGQEKGYFEAQSPSAKCASFAVTEALIPTCLLNEIGDETFQHKN